MTLITYLTIFWSIFAAFCTSASNTTLQLPITISPLVQNAIQLSDLSNSFVQLNQSFFETVTLGDIVKNLRLTGLVELKKTLKGIIVLGLAAISNGLTVDNFEFTKTSKWTITIPVEELAAVFKNTTPPLNDKIVLIDIQAAMFKVLETRFNFKTEEIAGRLNTTKTEVYAFFEPGWIKVVNFITEKNILALAANYTIAPVYIAEAVNLTLPELYNSTLPELENILSKKIEIIKGLYNALLYLI